MPPRAEAVNIETVPPTEPTTPVELTPEEKKKLLPKKYRHTPWRLEMLAVPKSQRKKYVYPDPHAFAHTGVRKSALQGACSTRIEHMSRNSLRTLAVNKRSYSSMRGEKFVKRMDLKIAESWNSIYNYYKKAARDKKLSTKGKPKHGKKGKGAGKGKGGKGKADKGGKGDKGGKSRSKTSTKTLQKKPKAIADMTPEEKDAEFIQWARSNSAPKKVPPQPPIIRGKIADLDQMGPRIQEIAMPKRVYVRPSQDSMNPEKLLKVKETALKYILTDRIAEMAQPAPFRLIREEPMIPGFVHPGALTAVITPRMTELAVPKPRAAAKEADFNENAFKISPNALKYVATPRMLELAKPLERD